MALVKRRAKEILNPFLFTDEEGDVTNLLDDMDVIDINIEDIVLGCIRSFKANEPESNFQDFVNTKNVIKIYKHVFVITAPSIRQYLRCSERQARKYVEVLRLCSTFIRNHLECNKSGITGYVVGSSSDIYVVTRSELGENG